MMSAAFVILVMIGSGWVAFRRRVRDRAYHYPDSESARLWNTLLGWLQWAVLFWILLAHLESRPLEQPIKAGVEALPVTNIWMRVVWPQPSPMPTTPETKRPVPPTTDTNHIHTPPGEGPAADRISFPPLTALE